LTKLNNGNLSIGLYEKALPKGLSWEERLNLARDAGYSFMEISIDETDERMERLKWDMVKKKNLKIISENTGIPILTMCLSGNRRFPIGSSFGDVQKKGVEMIADAIWFAFHLGIRIVQLAGYDVAAGEKSTKLSRETFGRNLRKSLNLAASLGVMLAIENVDGEFGYSLDAIMPYAGHIAAVHVKDTRPGIVRNVAFGEGTVDFLSAFNTLKSIGFNGPFLLEMWADDKKDNYEIIRFSREWVLEKMEKAGYE
jgi:L-ribulose-5-phosphate 3-epimerase